MEHKLNQENISAFKTYLTHEEKSKATIEKYMGAIRSFWRFLDGREVNREIVAEYKNQRSTEMASSTVNVSLAALNSLFSFLDWTDCRTKFLKIQRNAFRDSGRELTKTEYNLLVQTAMEQGKERLSLVMETICSTGIRVSELKYITVGAAKSSRAKVRLKGKIRTILLPKTLCVKLLRYANNKKIVSGEIFLSRNNKSLSRTQIWAEMKKLCETARVEASKVFPHNLRHLFATTYYQATKDIVKLADVLGHSSIDTTRIYLITTGEEHARQMELLGLVS